MNQPLPLRKEIRISVARQWLELWETACGEGSAVPGQPGRLLLACPVSTSTYGTGSEPGSRKTPLGRFAIAEKFGHGAPFGAVFKSREWTGEISPLSCPTPAPESADVGENVDFGQSASDDKILTRILWLAGLEPHNANTHERYIYLHGTNHEERIGHPASHGCVRMRSADIAALFEAVEPGTPVWIGEGEPPKQDGPTARSFSRT